MNTEEQQARYQLIENFQTVSSTEGASLRADPNAASDQYVQKLSEMVAACGHDETTHGYIMTSLDDLEDRKSLQAIRGLAQMVAHQACALKKAYPENSVQAQGYAKLETRAANVWRISMLRDAGTLPIHRQMEYRNIDLNSPSQVLKDQLPQVRDHVHPRFPQALTYS